MHYFRYLFCAILLFGSSLASHIYGTQALHEALQQGKKVIVINANDSFTDSDSIMAYMESLFLSCKYKDQVTNIFVTDDEANLATVGEVVQLMSEGKCYEEDQYAPIRKHYQDYYANRDQSKQTTQGFRVRDTAVILFPLADKLGVPIHIIQGQISTNPTYNLYLGNFGVDYGEQDQQYLNRIHPETGSLAVIKFIVEGITDNNSIYILSGGSLSLLSDIQKSAPHLLPQIDVTAMVFRQPMNFPPFNNPNRKWNPSWNEGIDRARTEEFITYASDPQNLQLGAFRIVDSNTVEYGMVCNGKMMPEYKSFISNKLQSKISDAALKTLIDTDARHKVFSTFDTKFMDSIVVHNAYGLITVPRTQGRVIQDNNDFNLRPVDGKDMGFPAHYPDNDGKHPYSCPRVSTPENRDKAYAEQYNRVDEFQIQTKKNHTAAWSVWDDVTKG